MEWLNRIFCILLGLVSGLGVGWLWHAQTQRSDLNTLVINHSLDKLPDNQYSFEHVIKQTVREEMIAQFASLNLPQQNCLPSTTIAEHEGRRSAGDPNTKVVLENIESTFQAASHSLDEVIAAGGFNYSLAKDFLEYINELPPDKAFELRLRHVRAINEGLSSSVLPEEALLKQ